jgi:hypothetical protein|tara:strand:+ start:802 stop:1218 length:417 start_codon:yes stop_codon:yes gene_type:complete
MNLSKAGIDLAKILCEDDPVRRDIPFDWRVQDVKREVFHLEERAVLCVAHLNDIPTTEKELMEFEWGTFSIFYTVWSKEKGLGRKIVLDTWELLKSQHPNNRYVTMSPKTEMAMKFHLSNGAILLQENETTNNFEYLT